MDRLWNRRFPFDRETLRWCVALTFIIEMLCVILRFGFGIESTAATASTIGDLTLGIRIHHGYLGVLLVPLGLIWNKGTKSMGWIFFVTGVSLVASDLIHHLLVLWPITGNPQFDLTYPASMISLAFMINDAGYL